MREAKPAEVLNFYAGEGRRGRVEYRRELLPLVFKPFYVTF